MLEDAHYHRGGYPTFLMVDGQEYVFRGSHPWQALEVGGVAADFSWLEQVLETDPLCGVGEIGLDRMHTRITGTDQLAVFRAQLALAARFERPVVLHGARCWGEVVSNCEPFKRKIPAFLFHGFSRSAGLLPKIFALNGYIGVGRAVLNEHAVNYREFVKTIPPDRMVVESDIDIQNEMGISQDESIMAIRKKLIELSGVDEAKLTDNLMHFIAALHTNRT